jgi:hypothetical protein
VGLLLWCRNGLDVQGIAGLVVAGIVSVVVFALTSMLFVYRNDRYVDLRLPRLRAWRRV